MPSHLILRATACAMFASAVAFTAVAQEEEDVVMATVNGHEIMQSDVASAISQLPPEVRQQLAPQVLIPMIADQLATAHLVAERGYADGLNETDEVQERLAAAERRIVQDVWLSRAVAERTNEEAVTALYEEALEAQPPVEEIHARHILLETEEDANAVIDELAAGADFAELAQERSIGPSAAQGGDLGYFREDDMVPAFSEAAFALQADEVSPAPVQSQFGWHIIKVEDRRMTEAPSLEDLRPQLEEQVRQQLTQEILGELRADAEIVILGPDGEPLPQGTNGQ